MARSRIFLVSFFVLVVGGSSCTEHELNPLTPDIWATPETIDFGTVTIGVPVEQVLEIHNVGGGTLTVDSVTLASGVGPFEVEDFSGVIAPDNHVELIVTFDAADYGAAEDVIEIASDDPDEALVEVPVLVVDVVEGPVPAISWTPSALDFGSVPSGGALTMSVTVTSVGTADLEVSAVALDVDTAPEFTIDLDPSPATLPPSYTTQIDVTYTPTDDIADSGTLLIESNDPDVPVVEVPLSGELDPAPDIELVPTSLLFGDVEIGTVVTMEAEIWSLGDADLELGTLALTGSSEFALHTDPSGLLLQPGEFTTVLVSYTPVDMTADTGMVEIPSNDPDENPAILELAGQHEPIPDIEVTPLQIDFGPVDIGTTASDSVMVSNVGTGDLSVDLPVLTGSTDFSFAAAQFPCVIAAGSSELIVVEYTPSDGGLDSGTLTIDSDDPDEPSVPVTLGGESAPYPDIDVDPWTVDFGDVTVFTTEVASVTIFNVGGADLDLTSITYSGDAEFWISSNPQGSVIPPGGDVQMEISFEPAAEVSYTGFVDIASTDPLDPVVTVDVVGGGIVPDIDLDPTVLDFGAVEVGVTVSMDAEIWSQGSADLELGSLSITGDPDFQIVVDPSLEVIVPGDFTTVTVSYTPSDMGSDAGWVEIPSNDPDENPVYLELVGEHDPIPDIDVTPTAIWFSGIDVGQTGNDSITVQNVGTGDLMVDMPTLSGSSEFAMNAASFPTSIPAGGYQTIAVAYTPVDLTSDTGEITITSDDPDEPTVVVPLTGDVTPVPDIDVTPTTLQFGMVQIGASSSLTATISNVGIADLELGTLLISGTTEFSITDDPSSEILAPGASTTVEVTYAPTDGGSDTATMEIPSNDPDENPVYVALNGAEDPVPDIDVDPLAVAFGNVDIGQSSSSTVTVYNVGGATLDVTAISLSGSTDFSWLSANLPGTISPAGSRTIMVTYTPTDEVADLGMLTIDSDDPDEPSVVVALTGAHTPYPDIEVDPLLLDFGDVPIDTADVGIFTISNVGDDDLEITSCTYVGDTEFWVSADPSGTVLVPGDSVELEVTFEPDDVWTYYGEIGIASNDPDEPVVMVEVIGGGIAPDIDVTPTLLQFGQVAIGSSSAMTATISNVGDVDLELDTLSISGTTEYSLTVDPSGTVLAPAASTSVEVTYAPVDVGADGATLSIPSNDPDEPVVYVTLNGADEPLPDIDVDPLLVNFGTVDVGQTDTDTITVSNLGTATLTVSAVTFSGSSEFTWNSISLPGTIGPGASRTITVAYSPLDEVADSGTITIDSDDPDEPSVVVSLAGQASPSPDIDVDPWTVDFGDVKAGDSDTATVTIYNVGDVDLELYSCVRSGDPNFTITVNPQGTIIAAGGSTTMEVAFYPTAESTYTGEIDIASDDPDEPVVTVDLFGAGVVPEINIQPSYHDLGVVEVNCSETLDIAVQSVGSAPLELHGQTFYTAPGSTMTVDTGDLDSYIANGWELQPGDSITVTLEFVPTDVMYYSGLLTVESDDPSQPYATSDIDGDGTPSGYASDNWQQTGSNESDVLWVVDNSCSMADEQGYLADDFGYFYSIVDGAGADYHIATVTTDNANFQGSTKVIDSTTPNGQAEFASNCTVGTGGSGTERGLMYGYNALSAAIAGTYPNTGFWRQDAGLQVIFVSDEADQSGDWGTYLSYYQGLKADPDYVVLSAICGTNGYVAQSCNGVGGSADPGYGYVDVANATGGVLGSICESDWSTVLTNLAWITVNLEDSFELTELAIESTIEVYVNGVQQMTGWTYDVNDNSVDFDPLYVPADGDIIEIDYGYYGAC